MLNRKVSILILIFARLVLLRKPLKIISLVDNKFMTKEGEFKLNGNENSDIEMENVLDSKGSPKMKIFNKNDQVLNANGKYLKWEKQDSENESLWIYTPVGNIGGTISDGEGNCFLRKEQSVSLSECSKEIDNLSKDYLYKIEIIENSNKSGENNQEGLKKSAGNDSKNSNNISNQENNRMESKTNQTLQDEAASYADKEEKHKKSKEEMFDGAEKLFEDQNIKIIRKHPHNTEPKGDSKTYLYKEEPKLHYHDIGQLYEDPSNFQNVYDTNSYSKQHQRPENYYAETGYRGYSHGFGHSGLPTAKLYKPYEQNPYDYKNEIRRRERNKFYRESEYYKTPEYLNRDYISDYPQKDLNSRKLLQNGYKTNDNLMEPSNNNGTSSSNPYKKDIKAEEDLDEGLKILMDLIEKFKKTKENAASKQKS